MDAELLALQAQFLAAQEQRASVRLSDRNIVELVVKLQQLGLLKSSLLHSTNGKEYITHDFLRDEIRREIVKSGRISLVDLASSLGVDLFYCEREVQALLSADSSISLFQGEVITQSYWDSVAEEIQETLIESGQVSMADLARQFNVAADVLIPAIKSRIGNTIHGTLENGQLYTSAYLSRIKSMVRGVVRGSTISTPLSSFWTLLQKLEAKENSSGAGTITDGALLSSLLSQVIGDGDVDGSMKSSSSIWIPSVFSSSQKRALDSFYSQNGMITFEMLQQFSSSSPSQIQSKFPDAIALETCLIHPCFLDQLDSAADEVINRNAWCDLLSFVPSSLTAGDCVKLAKLCPSISKATKEKSAFLIADTYLVTEAFFKTLKTKLEQAIISLPSKRFKTTAISSPSTHPSVTNQDSDMNTEERNGNEGLDDETQVTKARKKKQAAKPEKKEKGGSNPTKSEYKSKSREVEESINDGMDEEAPTSKGKSKKKNFKGREESTKKDQVNSNPSSKSSKNLSKNDSTAERFSEEELKALLLQWLPELEEPERDSASNDSFLEGLVLVLRPALSQFWNQITQSAFSENTEKIRRIRNVLQLRFDNLYTSFQLHTKSLPIFEDDPNLYAAIQKHILRTSAAEICDLFLHFQSVEVRIANMEETNEESIVKDGHGAKQLEDEKLFPNHISFSQSERNSMLQLFPSPLRVHASSLINSVEGKSVNDFEKELESFTHELGLQLKKLEKKTERSMTFSHKKVLAESIEREENPIRCLPFIVSFIFFRVHNRVLHVPGRLVSSIINILKPKLDPEEAQLLTQYLINTVKLLSESGAGNTPDSDPHMKMLTEMLSSMKKILQTS